VKSQLKAVKSVMIATRGNSFRSVAKYDDAQVTVNEAKTADGACYLELKVPSRSRETVAGIFLKDTSTIMAMTLLALYFHKIVRSTWRQTNGSSFRSSEAEFIDRVTKQIKSVIQTLNANQGTIIKFMMLKNKIGRSVNSEVVSRHEEQNPRFTKAAVIKAFKLLKKAYQLLSGLLVSSSGTEVVKSTLDVVSHT
nr:nuclear RNA polymerase D1B [Tanacetum cinerariifolium]